MRVTIDGERCLRCGACSTVVPAIFTLAAVRRAPETDEERELVRVAVLVCPSQAIGVSR